MKIETVRNRQIEEFSQDKEILSITPLVDEMNPLNGHTLKSQICYQSVVVYRNRPKIYKQMPANSYEEIIEAIVRYSEVADPNRYSDYSLKNLKEVELISMIYGVSRETVAQDYLKKYNEIRGII